MIRLLALLLFLPSFSHAVLARDTVSFSRVIWNERVKLYQGVFSDSGTASYLASALSWDRTWLKGRWGGGVSVMAGMGRASSGGFEGTTITFPDPGDRAFTLFGVTPRAFYRVTGQIQIGVSTPIISRNLSWASTDSSITVEARRAIGMGFGLDTRVLMTPYWELSQSLALLSTVAETYWQFGLHYRFY